MNEQISVPREKCGNKTCMICEQLQHLVQQLFDKRAIFYSDWCVLFFQSRSPTSTTHTNQHHTAMVTMEKQCRTFSHLVKEDVSSKNSNSNKLLYSLYNTERINVDAQRIPKIPWNRQPIRLKNRKRKLQIGKKKEYRKT